MDTANLPVVIYFSTSVSRIQNFIDLVKALQQNGLKGYAASCRQKVCILTPVVMRKEKKLPGSFFVILSHASAVLKFW